MGALTGTAPKATFDTQPTINPQQSSLMGFLSNLLQTGGTTQTTPLQDSALAGLQGVANALPVADYVNQNQVTSGALAPLYNAFNYQAPQNTAPTTAGAAPIDATQAFQTGVAQPLIDDFTSQVIPALKGGAGASAGGGYGSGIGAAAGTATTNLARTLGQQGSLYSLGAAQANQNVQQQTDLANLQSLLTTNQGNQSASLTGQSDILSALGLTPSVVGASDVPLSNMTQILNQILSGGATPISQGDALMQLMAGLSTAPTQQTIGVGTGGSSGLLSGLLSNAGGIATGLSSLFSDERLKDDITPVGKLDNDLPVYMFRYKGDSTPRIGLLAQDVEKVKPWAVHTTPSGYKAVNYALAALEAA